MTHWVNAAREKGEKRTPFCFVQKRRLKDCWVLKGNSAETWTKVNQREIEKPLLMQTENFSTKKYRFVKMRYAGLPSSGACSPRRALRSGSRKLLRVRRKDNRIRGSRLGRKNLNFRPPDFNPESRARASLASCEILASRLVLKTLTVNSRVKPIRCFHPYGIYLILVSENDSPSLRAQIYLSLSIGF